MSTTNERPTPETEARFTQAGMAKSSLAEFARKLERERDEAREVNAIIQSREAKLVLSKDLITKRAEAIRCELVKKEKQLEAMHDEIRIKIAESLASHFNAASPTSKRKESSDDTQ